jgi:hypothetical protein
MTKRKRDKEEQHAIHQGTKHTKEDDGMSNGIHEDTQPEKKDYADNTSNGIHKHTQPERKDHADNTSTAIHEDTQPEKKDHADNTSNGIHKDTQPEKKDHTSQPGEDVIQRFGLEECPPNLSFPPLDEVLVQYRQHVQQLLEQYDVLPLPRVLVGMVLDLVLCPDNFFVSLEPIFRFSDGYVWFKVSPTFSMSYPCDITRKPGSEFELDMTMQSDPLPAAVTRALDFAFCSHLPLLPVVQDLPHPRTIFVVADLPKEVESLAENESKTLTIHSPIRFIALKSHGEDENMVTFATCLRHITHHGEASRRIVLGRPKAPCIVSGTSETPS